MTRRIHSPVGVAPLLALALCALLSSSGWAATATLLGAPPRNFLKNSGFASGEFWILKGNATRWDPGAGRDGGGIRYSSFGGSGAEVVQTVGPTLAPGRRYTLSAWVRSTSPGSVAVVGARWEGGYPRVFRGVDPEDGWVRIEFRFDAPVDPGWRQVVLSGTGDLIWDDVGLYEAETLEEQLAAEWEDRLSSGEPIYTGLVVNALGTRLERGMSPKIYDVEGRLIFAGVGAGESQLFTEGIVAYVTDLRQAVSHPRLRVSEAYPLRLPLVVDVQDTRGLPRTDAVVGEADARLIMDAVRNYDFLGRFAVVFVVEPFSGL